MATDDGRQSGQTKSKQSEHAQGEGPDRQSGKLFLRANKSRLNGAPGRNHCLEVTRGRSLFAETLRGKFRNGPLVGSFKPLVRERDAGGPTIDG